MGIDGSAGFSPEMGGLYGWVDQFRFSRPIKNIARDFSDAVLLAEILAQAIPAWVQLHNYPSTYRFQQKLSNWETLNRKVLTRLKCEVSLKHQEDLANAVPGAIELLLIHVKRATAGSPYLQAKSESEAANARPSPTLHRHSSRSTERPLSPQGNTRPSVLSFELSEGEQPAADESTQHESITTSFSKILQLMATSTVENADQDKSHPIKARSSANTRVNAGPVESPRAGARASLIDAAVPNYAKPTKSNTARVRPASTDSKSRSPSSPPTNLTLQIPEISEALSGPGTKVKSDHVKESLVDLHNADANDLPSCSTEFQEDSFVYFLCGEESPTCSESSTGKPKDRSEREQAQVARVIKTLPSGECLLQLYKRVPLGGRAESIGDRKSRDYSSTPHFIDCCGSMLHNIQHMTYDAQAHRWKWHSDQQFNNTMHGLNARSASNAAQKNPGKLRYETAVVPATSARRYFFTEVLTRHKCSPPASFPGPGGVQTIATTLSVCCLECPSFTATFEIPATPTVFPKVYVTLNTALPDRFSARSPLLNCNCVK